MEIAFIRQGSRATSTFPCVSLCNNSGIFPHCGFVPPRKFGMTIVPLRIRVKIIKIYIRGRSLPFPGHDCGGGRLVYPSRQLFNCGIPDRLSRVDVEPPRFTRLTASNPGGDFRRPRCCFEEVVVGLVILEISIGSAGR